MEAIPVRPKLESRLAAPPLEEATPTPRAMMKGTVIGPVVAPPASKPMARKAGSVRYAHRNTMA